jgi:hypothetical protein
MQTASRAALVRGTDVLSAVEDHLCVTQTNALPSCSVNT